MNKLKPVLSLYTRCFLSILLSLVITHYSLIKKDSCLFSTRVVNNLVNLTIGIETRSSCNGQVDN